MFAKVFILTFYRHG